MNLGAIVTSLDVRFMTFIKISIDVVSWFPTRFALEKNQ